MLKLVKSLNYDVIFSVNKACTTNLCTFVADDTN